MSINPVREHFNLMVQLSSRPRLNSLRTSFAPVLSAVWPWKPLMCPLCQSSLTWIGPVSLHVSCRRSHNLQARSVWVLYQRKVKCGKQWNCHLVIWHLPGVYCGKQLKHFRVSSMYLLGYIHRYISRCNLGAYPGIYLGIRLYT